MAKNIFFIIFLLIFSGLFDLTKSENFLQSEKTTKESILTTDYFKKNNLKDYILGPGDKLIIVASSNYPELTKNVSIDTKGTITLEKVNNIYVEGLTIKELVDLLNKAYREFLKFPDVEIQIIGYRTIKLFVKGEVANPGLKTLDGSINPQSLSETNLFTTEISYFPTIFDALRASGGITRFSDLKNIEVFRENPISKGGGYITTTLNFEDTLQNGNQSQNIRIYDGDIINVNKAEEPNDSIFARAIDSKINSKFIKVYISGRVFKQGEIKISRASSLNDAISAAGGIKIIRGPLNFIRFNNDGTITKRSFKFKRNAKRGSYKNPIMLDGDILYVGDSFLSNATQILGEISAPFSNAFSSYGLYKALTN